MNVLIREAGPYVIECLNLADIHRASQTSRFGQHSVTATRPPLTRPPLTRPPGSLNVEPPFDPRWTLSRYGSRNLRHVGIEEDPGSNPGAVKFIFLHSGPGVCVVIFSAAYGRVSGSW